MKPSRGPLVLCHCLPGQREHVALQRQPFASAWPCRQNPFIGFPNCAEHGPPGHETLPWAFSALPLPSQRPGHVVIIYLEGFKTAAKHGPPGHETLPWAFATGFKSTVHQDTKPSRGPLALCQCLHSHREHVALQRQPFASAWPCRHSPFRGLQNGCKARSTRTRNLFSRALCHCLPSTWPCRHSLFQGFQNGCKAFPPGHENLPWACSALPLPSQVTANMLPRSGSPLPAPVAIYFGFIRKLRGYNSL